MKIGPWRESQKPCTVSTSTVLPLAPAMARRKARAASTRATHPPAFPSIKHMAPHNGVPILALAAPGGDGGSLALDHAARADQFQRPPLRGRHGLGRRHGP